MKRSLTKSKPSTDSHSSYNLLPLHKPTKNSFLSSTVIKLLIIDLLTKEEDEVLYAIAEELGKVFELLENKTAFLPLLESLCSADETVVRNQAVKSLINISKALSSSSIEEVFAPMVIRLSSMETLPSRLSSIGLITCCYKQSGKYKQQLRK